MLSSCKGWSLGTAPCHRLLTLFLRGGSSWIRSVTHSEIYSVPREQGFKRQGCCYTVSSDCHEGKPVRIPREPEVALSEDYCNGPDIYGEPQPFIRNVFCLDTCSLIVNTQICEFSREEEMLRQWTKFLQEVDPDVIIGYNISNFDFPYLLDRANKLKVGDFPFWTRLSHQKSESRDTSFASKQMGNRDTKATNT